MALLKLYEERIAYFNRELDIINIVYETEKANPGSSGASLQ